MKGNCVVSVCVCWWFFLKPSHIVLQLAYIHTHAHTDICITHTPTHTHTYKHVKNLRIKEDFCICEKLKRKIWLGLGGRWGGEGKGGVDFHTEIICYNESTFYWTSTMWKSLKVFYTSLQAKILKLFLIWFLLSLW